MTSGAENKVVFFDYSQWSPESLEKFGYHSYFLFHGGKFWQEELSHVGENPSGALVAHIIAPRFTPAQRLAFISGWDRARLEALRQEHLNRADKYLRRAFFFSYLSIAFAILAIVMVLL